MKRPAVDPVLEEYARLAPGYDHRWSFYVRSTIENTLARLPLREGERILDVGCGTGQLLAALAERPFQLELHGVDPSRDMLAVAQTRLPQDVHLATARAGNLPFPNRTFDWIVSTSVFHYIKQPRLALAEFHRVLKPAGNLLITDWCDDYLACKICDRILRVVNRAHFRTYTRAECQHLLRESAFNPVLADRYRISFLWGLMTVQASKFTA